jgi:hypothetical protein
LALLFPAAAGSYLFLSAERRGVEFLHLSTKRLFVIKKSMAKLSDVAKQFLKLGREKAVDA